MLPSNLILAIFMVDGHHDHDLLILIILRFRLRVLSTMIAAFRHNPCNPHCDHHGHHGDHPRLENCLMFTESPTL